MPPETRKHIDTSEREFFMDIIIELLQNLHEDIDFEEEDSLLTDGILDDADIESLISDIKDNFGVDVTPDMVTPENFNSAEAIYNLVTELSDEQDSE